MPLAFLFCLGVPTVLAILVNSSPWILVFFFTLAVMIAGELHYRLVDSRLRSDPPLSISGKPFSFFQPITTRDLRVLHYTAPLSGWAGANLRIAHLSGFHAHTAASIGYFHSVIEQVNKSAQKIWEQLGISGNAKDKPWKAISEIELQSGHKLGEINPIFARVEDADIKKRKEKFETK